MGLGRRAKVLKLSEKDAPAGSCVDGKLREPWVVAQAAALGTEIVVMPKDNVAVAP